MTPKRTGAWDFGRAVFSEAWTYAACGTGAAILSIWGWATGRVPPAWLFLAIVAAGSLVGGFRTWKQERVDRNALVAKLVDAYAELDELSRPRFLPEISEVPIEEDPLRPGWIKIYINLVIRNQGADSAIDRWRIVVLPPPPATPHIQDGKSLNAAQRGPHNLMSGNLLNDREIIRRGGTKEGWLLYEGPKDRLGITMGQMPVVEVSFKDVHGREYHVVSRPGFEKQMEDIRMGRFGSR
jgi:hypothetical protein